MRTKNRLRWWALGLAMLSPVWLLGACRHGCGEGGKRIEKMSERIADHLDLNDAQTAKLQEIKKQMQAARKQREADREADQKEIVALVSAKQLDKGKIRDLIEKRRESFEETVPLIVDRVAELHAMLDDKQKEKIVKFLSRWQGCGGH